MSKFNLIKVLYVYHPAMGLKMAKSVADIIWLHVGLEPAQDAPSHMVLEVLRKARTLAFISA